MSDENERIAKPCAPAEPTGQTETPVVAVDAGSSEPLPGAVPSRSERVVAALARYEARPKRPSWWGRR